MLDLERVPIGVGLGVGGRGDGRAGRRRRREPIGVDARVELACLWAKVDRLLKFRPDEVACRTTRPSALPPDSSPRPSRSTTPLRSRPQLTSRNDSLQAHHLAELVRLDRPRRRVVVAKAAAEAHVVRHVRPSRRRRSPRALDDVRQGEVRGWKVRSRFLEQPERAQARVSH